MTTQNRSQSLSNPHIYHGELTPSHDTTPIVIAVHCPTPDEVKIECAPQVDRSGITDYAMRVLAEICSRACVSSVVISSGARTIEAQARIMYDNARRDVAAQR